MSGIVSQPYPSVDIIAMLYSRQCKQEMLIHQYDVLFWSLFLKTGTSLKFYDFADDS